MKGRPVLWAVLTCERCQQEFRVKPFQARIGRRFCSTACRYPAGGPKYYKIVNRGAKQISEHRLIVEHALGHQLRRTAHVHHVNGDIHDNSHSNLVVCDSLAYHRLLHALQRVKSAGGRPFLDRICGDCGVVRPVTDFYQRTSRGIRQPDQRCKKCARIEVQGRRNARYLARIQAGSGVRVDAFTKRKHVQEDRRGEIVAIG